jgi:hypothetical protein
MFLLGFFNEIGLKFDKWWESFLLSDNYSCCRWSIVGFIILGGIVSGIVKGAERPKKK